MDLGGRGREFAADTLCRRSNSWAKCCSSSCGRTVTPHTGQHDGSAEYFFLPDDVFEKQKKKVEKNRISFFFFFTRNKRFIYSTVFMISTRCAYMNTYKYFSDALPRQPNETNITPEIVHILAPPPFTLLSLHYIFVQLGICIARARFV